MHELGGALARRMQDLHDKTHRRIQDVRAETRDTMDELDARTQAANQVANYLMHRTEQQGRMLGRVRGHLHDVAMDVAEMQNHLPEPPDAPISPGLDGLIAAAGGGERPSIYGPDGPEPGSLQGIFPRNLLTAQPPVSDDDTI